MITHALVKFDKFLHDTDKAILVNINGKEYWFPKKLCRKIIINKKLGGNFVIPSFFYEKVFGELPSELDAETIVEKHIPIKLEPINQIINESLTR